MNEPVQWMVIKCLLFILLSCVPVHGHETVEMGKGVLEGANYKCEYTFGKDRRVEHIEAEHNCCCFYAPP